MEEVLKIIIGGLAGSLVTGIAVYIISSFRKESSVPIDQLRAEMADIKETFRETKQSILMDLAKVLVEMGKYQLAGACEQIHKANAFEHEALRKDMEHERTRREDLERRIKR